MNKIDKSINRIKKYEKIYDDNHKIINDLNILLDKYLDEINSLEDLFNYYSSSKYIEDFENDENGSIPNNVKRGILSEDAIYDLLQENDELLNKMKKIINKRN